MSNKKIKIQTSFYKNYTKIASMAQKRMCSLG